MKTKFFFAIVFLISAGINIHFFTRENICVENNEPGSLHIYPEDQSSIDFPVSYDPENPKYKNFSLEGEVVVYVNFSLKGSIIESFRRKYDFVISDKLIKNIQEIIYFLNDYKIKFNEGDRLTLFYNEKDEKIIYLKFRNSVRKTISEVYLFNSLDGEKYFTADGLFLQPCITNGPFEGCPQVRFINDNNQLFPVFDVKISEKVKLPFLAKLMNTGQAKNTGGECEFIYSNFATRAYFKGLGNLNNLKKDSLYKKDVIIGKSGFVLQDGRNGVVYFLRKKDSTPVSPFNFHHIERTAMPEKYSLNFQIIRNFYARQLEFAKEFEKQYY